MPPVTAAYRWSDVPQTLGLTVLYLLLAAASAAFATDKGHLPLIFLPSGLALAFILLRGTRHWPGIFLGAVITHFLTGHAPLAALTLSALLTLEILLGVWLLARTSFDNAMPRARDFFLLFLLAGAIASGLSMLAAMFLLALPGSAILNLWLSNALGITLLAPFILVWRQPLQHKQHNLFLGKRTLEFVALAALSFVFGQILFLDLLHEQLGRYPQEYLMFIFVVWAATRFGRHGVLLILGMAFIQAMMGVSQGIGNFSQEIARGDLMNLALYCTELAFIGMLLAGAIRERNSAALTAQKNAARVKRVTQLYHALSHINQGIARLQDEAALFPLVCRAAVESGGMALAWVGIAGPDRMKILPQACYGDAVDYIDGLDFPLSPEEPEKHGPSAISLREGRHVVSNTFLADPNTASWHERARKFGIHASASFPIMRGGMPYAVLCVYSEHEYAFDDEAIRLLEEMSSDIGFALDNLDRDQQRRQAQLALVSSEQRFRAFFERSMIGMATVSPEKGWLEVNDALCKMLGYSRTEMLLTTWDRISHPEDIATGMSLFNRALRGRLDEYEQDKRYIRKDGNIMHAHVAVRCLRKENGSINYFVCLILDTTESKRSAEVIWKQANFDSLTGLINRNLFHDRLQQEIKKSKRTRLPLALVYIDLDRFKEVNDTHGHAAGDMVLIEAAQRIQSCVRASDTLARIGGDEFVIIIAQCPDRAPVNQIAEKIIVRLDEPFLLGGESAHVTASIGIAFYPDDAPNLENLLSYADQAMYASKNQGRSRMNYFSRAMQEASKTRAALIHDLSCALTANQFRLYFQPIVELSSNRILKAEALLRWQHPVNGLIEPGHFIPLAEETGMILKIGDWAFREAARWAHRWRSLQEEGVQISVNKSPMQFMVQGIDPLLWIDHLRELGVPGQHIALEITEGVLMNSEPCVMDKLLKFRDAGIQVALDDFGTGYSSLSYLNKFDIDYLKIDRSFIRNVAHDPFDKSLSEAIIVMAHTLGLKVIAEGVETEAQRELLLRAGCDYAQGFLFAPPLTGEEFEAMLH